MNEQTLANIPENVGDLCSVCGQVMPDHEPCNMAWDGTPISHIRCKKDLTMK